MAPKVNPKTKCAIKLIVCGDSPLEDGLEPAPQGFAAAQGLRFAAQVPNHIPLAFKCLDP